MAPSFAAVGARWWNNFCELIIIFLVFKLLNFKNDFTKKQYHPQWWSK